MNQVISEEITKSVLPGEVVDMYYPSEATIEKSAYGSYQENRFVTALQSTNFGSSSTILFNPTQGLSDVMITLEMPDSLATSTGLALSQGWGYTAIKSVGIRVGSSSLYYWASDQLFIRNMAECEDSDKKEQIAYLGGQACSGASDFADPDKRTAYVVIKNPFTSVSAQQKPMPLPTDLLTQPVQWIIELAPASQVFVVNPVSASPLPSQYASAEVNFRQIHLLNGNDQLATRVNMNENALVVPLKFGFQQSVFRTTQTQTSTTTPIQINLTGVRNGSLKSIDLWCCRADDFNGGNMFRLGLMKNIKLLINGLVYYTSRGAQHQLLSLLDNKVPLKWDEAFCKYDASGNLSVGSVTASFVNIPFAIHTEDLAGEYDIALGIAIQNSVMNLEVSLPETGVPYVISAQYNYASNLMFSKGGAEYIF
jgi:hypothetical protein